MANIVQYGLWGNCSNHCDFCLKKDKTELTREQLIQEIRETRKNLRIVDWSGQFRDGISLLGGELFHIMDKHVQDEFMLLVEDIINIILKNVPTAVFSCVTNGIYNHLCVEYIYGDSIMSYNFKMLVLLILIVLSSTL